MSQTKPLDIDKDSCRSVRTAGYLKLLSLFLLVCQTVGAIIVMRVSKTVYADAETPYLNSTAVFFAEIVKLIGSSILILKDSNRSSSDTLKGIWYDVVVNFRETLMVGIPSFLYTVQNNLLFIALANLPAAIYQATYQLKILTTAILSVIILQKKFSLVQWISLVLLTISVALIQTQGIKPTNDSSITEGNPLIGLVAVLFACVTSGFAGVYFEKILKGSTTSIWMRNIQLSLTGSILALIGVYWNDYSKIQQKGFMQGYNMYTWLAILFHSAGGLIVAMVLKYADNILKCFANAVAIIMSCMFSQIVLKEYKFSIISVLGISMIIVATFSYGVNPSFSRISQIFSNMFIRGNHVDLNPSLTSV